MSQSTRKNGELVRSTNDLFAVDEEKVPTESLMERLGADIQTVGGEITPDPELIDAVGKTMFDLPGSEDNTVTVLLPQQKAQMAASQSLVRIKSRENGDGKTYLGIVAAGPFAEPDSLRGDSHMLVTVATRGADYQAPFHGRIQVAILGEELADGTLCSPRLRPLPNSPVFALTEEESAKVLKASGNIRLGLVVGHKNVVVGIPSEKKEVLPRHTAVLGTTGGGKSTTIARLVQQAQEANMAIILLDVEGEYTHLHEPTTKEQMKSALSERGMRPKGIPSDRMTIYHLVGRDTANPEHPNVRPFSLQFARLSPYAAAEILGLSEPQQQRYMRAYDIAKELMRDLGLFPAKNNEEQERIAMELDEFERGYPRMTLRFLMDAVAACLKVAEIPKRDERAKGPESKLEFTPHHPKLRSSEGQEALRKKIYSGSRPDSAVSWGALLGKLGRLNRLNVFDTDGVAPMIYKDLLEPGTVSVIDLSDSGMSELTNIVIADLLRGVQDAQEAVYQSYEKAKKVNPAAASPSKTMIVIEEAHEFLSAERIDKMDNLFEQVARIAKRGRKRWLGLVFVTQLPQHLPRQIFGLVNSYILHKITDPQVVATLRKTVSGIDEGLWNRLPGLAPGQAIASFPHMTRPLLVSVDPATAELRLVD
jgi:DNA helicase HerA-like ATPase